MVSEGESVGGCCSQRGGELIVLALPQIRKPVGLEAAFAPFSLVEQTEAVAALQVSAGLPGVFGRLADESGADGIEIDLGQGREQP